jgi:hypothetical protein
MSNYELRKRKARNNMDLSKYNPNSQFLLYKTDKGDIKVDVLLQNETIWLPQKGIAQLFGCSTDNVSLHFKNIFAEGELDPNSVTEEISATISILETVQIESTN